MDALQAAFLLIAKVIRLELSLPEGASESVRLLVPDAKSLVGDTAIGQLQRASGGARIAVGASPQGGKDKLLTCEGSADQTAHIALNVADAVAERHRTRHKAFFSQWAFETCYNDHFETPSQAYADILPVLQSIGLQRWRRQHKRKRKRAEGAGIVSDALLQLTLYDPYYCQGSLRAALVGLGLSAQRCINENRDFYRDVDEDSVPVHDVLVTNPPYSADHKQRLLSILLRQQRGELSGPVPFLLLMPAWLANTDYWLAFVRELGDVISARESRGENSGCVDTRLRGGDGSDARDGEAERRAGICYICPSSRYEFSHPQSTGKAASPFHAIWFCGGFETPAARREAVAGLSPARKSGSVELFRSNSMLRKREYFA